MVTHQIMTTYSFFGERTIFFEPVVVCRNIKTLHYLHHYLLDMNKNKKLLIGFGLCLMTSFLMGAIFQKSEATLAVIKAGVDQDGNPVCINKSQVYLFKKLQAQNKIEFLYHDPIDEKASVVKSFADSISLDKYWDSLIKNW